MRHDRRWLALTLACVAASSFLGPAVSFAQLLRNGIVTPYEARRSGLERVWASQVQVDRSRGRVVAVVPHVSMDRTTTLFEITHENRVTTVSQHHLDPFRREIGVDGAKKRADQLLDNLKKLKVTPEPTMISRTVPEITLYATTDLGLVQAIDAETGKTRWTASVGRYDFPTTAAAANEKYVAVINGSNLYILSARNGSPVWERRLSGVPMAGPALSESHVFIPTSTGMVESYTLDDNPKDPEPLWRYKGDGRMLVQPIVGSGTLAWSTDRGHIYVSSVNPRAMRYRLDTNSHISAQPSILGTRLFASSSNGYVYCLNLLSENIENRRVLWRFPMGEGSNQTPIAIRDSVYAITHGGALFCLNVETGEERWRASGVYRFLSASDTRVYGVGDIGRLVVLDQKTGAKISEIVTDEIDLHVANTVTDRLFIGTKTGVLICMRETANQYPVVHAMVVDAPKPKRQPLKKEADGGMNPDKGADPFAVPAAGPDPFGAEAMPKKPDPADDPFGGGAMEKKPTPPKPADDPFGG